MLERLFHLRALGTQVRTEILAGVTTFFTMAYIIFVNPAILGKAGMPEESVWVATCLAAALGSLIMGLWANYPIAQAPGMGLNAFFAYSIVLTMGYTWQQALGMVFISGLIFLVLTYTGLRAHLVNAIPAAIVMAIPPGIGLFIAFIGLNNAGLIRVNQGPVLEIIGQAGTADPAALIQRVQQAPPQILELGDITAPGGLLTFMGLGIMALLYVRKVPAALLLTLGLTTLIGIPMGVTQVPTSWSMGTFDLSATWLKLDLVGLLDPGDADSWWDTLGTLLLIVLSFTLVDMFDSIGTLIATASKGNLLDEHGQLPRINRALAADAWATTLGALLGTSTVTAYVESSTGIVAGGRSGLTAVMVGLCFLLAILLAPLAGMIPAAATAPVLVMVGILMMEGLKKIPFSQIEVAIPAFMVIVMMPFTYSIAHGIAFGIIFHVLIQIFTGKARKVSPVLYLLAGLFLIKFFHG